MAQIRSIVSESLEAQIRSLLPSQNGFTEDLQAQNVIVPVIDLTSAASGTNVPLYQQQAWDFSTGIATVKNTTTTLVSTAGFWQIGLNWSGFIGTTRTASVQLNDGTTTKKVWEFTSPAVSASTLHAPLTDDFIVYLRSGDLLSATTNNTTSILNIWYRQLADVNGTVTNPLGFTPQ